MDGLHRATIRQKFSNHTLLLLDYDIVSKQDYLLPPENTPVEVTYGNGPTASGLGYGYVNHYETVTGQNGKAMTRMVVMGTSKVMDSVNPTAWSDYTRSGIVREIATRHRLRSVVNNHPAVVENWATGGRSDFQSLKALADEIGYQLWVDGATLWFLDPAQIVRSASAVTTPLVRTRHQRNVKVMGGTNIPGEMKASRRQMIYGIDASTNEFFEATSGSPLLATELASTPVDNFLDAQYTADAMTRQQQDQSVLKATVAGNPTIAPGVVVNFEASGVNTDQAGLWVVNSSEHVVDRRDYTTTISASRGAERLTLSRVPNTIRTASGHARAVVRNGLVWESALQERVYV